MYSKSKKISLIILISIISGILHTSCITTKQSKVEYIPRETALPGWRLVNERFFKNRKDKDLPEYLKKLEKFKTVSLSEYVFFSDDERRVNLTVISYNDFISSLSAYSEILISTEKEIIYVEEFTALSDEKYVTVHENLVIIVETTEKDYSVVKEFKAAVIEMMPEENKKAVIPREVKIFAGSRNNLLYLKRGLSHLPEINNIFIRYRENYRLLYKQYSSEEALMRVFANLSDAKTGYTLGQFQDFTYLFKEDNKGKIVLVFYYKDWILSVIDADNINDARTIAARIIVEAKEQGL